MKIGEKARRGDENKVDNVDVRPKVELLNNKILWRSVYDAIGYSGVALYYSE